MYTFSMNTTESATFTDHADRMNEVARLLDIITWMDSKGYNTDHAVARMIEVATPQPI